MMIYYNLKIKGTQIRFKGFNIGILIFYGFIQSLMKTVFTLTF